MNIPIIIGNCLSQFTGRLSRWNTIGIQINYVAQKLLADKPYERHGLVLGRMALANQRKRNPLIFNLPFPVLENVLDPMCFYHKHHRENMTSSTVTLKELRHSINEDRGPIMMAVICMLLGLCFIATSARILARWVSRVPFAADDYLILIALVRDPLIWSPKP